MTDGLKNAMECLRRIRVGGASAAGARPLRREER
jgi:hypothetical protein